MKMMNSVIAQGILWMIGALSGQEPQLHVIPIVIQENSLETQYMGPTTHSSGGADGTSFLVIDGSDQSLDLIEKRRLEWIEDQEWVFHKASLGLVVQALAEACKMNYIAPSDELFSQEVTLRVKSNPYRVLQLLSRQYGFSMSYSDGAWDFYEEDTQQLVSRTYQLLFSDGSSMDIRPPSVSGAVRNATSSGDRGSEGVFDESRERIVEDIRSLLQLPVDANWQVGQAISSVESFAPVTATYRKRVANPVAAGGQVFYVAETSSLLVVATKAHHRMVEEYLKVVDQRQKLVKIQALIVESSRPDQLSEGVDWSGVSGVRFGVGGLSREFQKSWEKNRSYSGMGDTDGSVSESVEWASSRTDTALLSAGDFSWTLNFLRTHGESRVINDPTAVTLNRRPVRFETVTELPIQTGSSSTTSSVSTSSIQQTEYIEVGFFLDVIPQIVPGGIYGWDEEAVQLNVSIVVSNQVGEQKIGDRPYPITARRTYAYSVVVPSGYTLAIGGLREDGEKEVRSSIPLLGDLPLLGFLFRSTEKEKTQRNLVAYITPTILDRSSPEWSRYQP
jgi:hypothetical protein